VVVAYSADNLYLSRDESLNTTGYYPVTAVIFNPDLILRARTIDGQCSEATPDERLSLIE